MQGMDSYFKTELEKARRMQGQLIPTNAYLSTLCEMHAVDVAHYFEPSEILSGDFWGCHGLSDEEVCIYITDFSGHGLTAAINTFRFHALLQNQVKDWGRDPSHFVTILNRQIASLLAVEQFATMFYGIIHSGLNSLFYIGCGAPQPLIIRKDGRSEWVDSGGLPIGINSEYQYLLHEATFEPGDMLVLYSDLLIDDNKDIAPFYTEDSLRDTVVKTFLSTPDAHKAEAVKEALLKPLRLASGEIQPLSDDLTVTVYYRKPY